MLIASLVFDIYIPTVHSLKEKRMYRKSLTDKIQNKFNVSIAESHEQDTHQIIGISIVSLVSNKSMGDSVLDNILNFIEKNCDGEIMNIEREFL